MHSLPIIKILVYNKKLVTFRNLTLLHSLHIPCSKSFHPPLDFKFITKNNPKGSANCRAKTSQKNPYVIQSIPHNNKTFKSPLIHIFPLWLVFD